MPAFMEVATSLNLKQLASEKLCVLLETTCALGFIQVVTQEQGASMAGNKSRHSFTQSSLYPKTYRLLYGGLRSVVHTYGFRV